MGSVSWPPNTRPNRFGKTFRIGGEKIIVNAKIHTLGGFSAHASQSQMLDWINHFTQPRPRLYLIHGEEKTKVAFRDFLNGQGWEPNIPELNESITF